MDIGGSQDFAALEHSGWSEAGTAQAYARDFAKAAEYCVPVLVSQARAAPGTPVLDLCCGHGIVAEGLALAGARVTGLDFSPAMLDLARARVPQARFVAGDAMDLPFAQGDFAAVTIGFGIPHVPDPPRVFAQARRVLAPGGRLAYSVWQDAEGGLGYVFRAIAEHGDPGIALPPGPGAHDYAEPERARTALEQAGFTEIALTEVDSRWQVIDPAAPYDFFHDGTVRGGALLRAQPPARKAAIRRAVAGYVTAAHGTGPDWDIPIPSVVISATAA